MADESETKRTDAREMTASSGAIPFVVDADFTRALERELNEAKAALSRTGDLYRETLQQLAEAQKERDEASAKASEMACVAELMARSVDRLDARAIAAEREAEALRAESNKRTAILRVVADLCAGKSAGPLLANDQILESIGQIVQRAITSIDGARK